MQNQAPLRDYHLHTLYSFDSQQSPAALADAAERAGLCEICVTDHIDLGYILPEGAQPPDLARRRADLDAARRAHPGLHILEGIEIGDNPAERGNILAFLRAHALDFHLLSLHMVDGGDPYFPAFFAGRARADAYRRYAECAAASVAAWDPADYDCAAHLGYVAKFAPYADKPFRWRDAPDAIDAVLRCLAQNGKALEINTSSLKNSPETMASADILRRFRELGGELVTLGSDAHAPEYVGYRLDYARELALSCGFRYGAAYARRTLRAYKLENAG